MRRVIVGISAIAIIVGSVIIAITIHRPLVYCSYVGTVTPPCAHPTDYPVVLRIGIVIIGIAIGALITVGGRVLKRRR